LYLNKKDFDENFFEIKELCSWTMNGLHKAKRRPLKEDCLGVECFSKWPEKAFVY
jgi:hypothetical protein